MNSLDFTNPARDELYDPKIAHECFESLGQVCDLAKDEAFFAENEKSNFLYLLIEGEVRLFRRKRVLDIVRTGEIFGEMAAITGNPRTAWAIARTPCKALQLNPTQFKKALRATPEFALMLIRIMINRIRVTLAVLARTGKLSKRLAAENERVFSEQVIKELSATLGNRPPIQIAAKKIIMREGDSGAFMYVVLSGRIAVYVNKVIIGHAGPGGAIGEIALVDGSGRAVTAMAETDSALLPIGRDDFLKMVRSDPRFAVTMLRSVARKLARMTATSAW
jgi:CRP/FNR family cyclic AMP-dependent transcriptional regulator